MQSENSDVLVHEVIGRLFEEPEPAHRANLADGAIAEGAAVMRRRGFGVAGATLSVLAVVGGSMALAGGGSGSGSAGTDWSLGSGAGHVSAQAYESDAPTFSDRQREIIEQLPGVFGAVLPAGMTVTTAAHSGAGVTDSATGDFSPTLVLHAGGADYALEVDPLQKGYIGAFARTSAKPIPVTGGSIRVAVVKGGAEAGASGFTAWYEFAPWDPAAPAFRFELDASGQAADSGQAPIDAAAFKKMVEAPGFAALQKLMDPSVPASAAAVRERYAIEAKINAEAKKVLPEGFRLKLNPGVVEGVELVGPSGVDVFDWDAHPGKPTDCPAGSVCYATGPYARYTTVGPDGRARLGMYMGVGDGAAAHTVVTLWVFGTTNHDPAAPMPPGKAGSETAPQGPGLTPQQARAIITAPGLAKVIADVHELAVGR